MVAISGVGVDGFSGDGHQAGQSAVQGHGQVRLLEPDAGQNQGRNQTTGSGGVGVQEDDGNRVGGVGRGGLQNRTAVEAEPAHPQDEGTQSRHRQVGTRNGVDFTVLLPYLPLRAPSSSTPARAAEAPAMCTMPEPGEVAEAQVTQGVHAEDRSAAPGPGAFHRVDEAGHDHCESQEGPQLHALGNSTGDDGHGSCHEHHLEEEVGRRSIVAVTNAHDSRQEVAAVVHDGVAAHQVT